MNQLKKIYAALSHAFRVISAFLDDGDFNQKICDERMRKQGVGPHAKQNL